jgi:hypothetical protein
MAIWHCAIAFQMLQMIYENKRLVRESQENRAEAGAVENRLFRAL